MPTDEEILVETECSGVSQGTGIWAYRGLRPELTFATVPGHQTVGKIIQAGKGTAGFAVGRRVPVKSNRLPGNLDGRALQPCAHHGSDRAAARLAQARETFGADAVISSRQGNVAAELREAAHGPLDAILEATGDAPLAD